MDITSVLFIIVPILIIIIPVIYSLRKGTTAIKTKPIRMKVFEVPKSLEDARKIILKFALESEYDFEDVESEPNRIILSDKFKLTKPGFFYPIYISIKEGNTVVEVGIKNRLGLSRGPFVTKMHSNIVNQLKATFLINTE